MPVRDSDDHESPPRTYRTALLSGGKKRPSCPRSILRGNTDGGGALTWHVRSAAVARLSLVALTVHPKVAQHTPDTRRSRGRNRHRLRHRLISTRCCTPLLHSAAVRHKGPSGSGPLTAPSLPPWLLLTAYSMRPSVSVETYAAVTSPFSFSLIHTGSKSRRAKFQPSDR